jgi:putative DNA methylase
VGPFSRAWRFFEWNLRPSSFTPAQGHDRCLVCNASVPLEHIRSQGQRGGLGIQLMAIAADGPDGRAYLPPTAEHLAAAQVPRPVDAPETALPKQAIGFRVQAYGLARHADLFTNRQLLTLVTLSDLAREARTLVLCDAKDAGLDDDGIGLDEGAHGARAYADAIGTYLAFAVSKVVNASSSLSRWRPDAGKEGLGELFARQAVSMVWNFAEGNPFHDGPTNVGSAAEWIAKAVAFLPAVPTGIATQHDVCADRSESTGWMISTDPPYYDNVAYADLSDVFYVWLRRILQDVYPELLRTLLTPKDEELVADPFRRGGPEAAKEFFEQGFQKAFSMMRRHTPADLPITMFYAYRQSGSDAIGDSSTAWEAMLSAMLRSGWSVTGTWPMRTELSNRIRTLDSNALSSSIVLVCRPRNARSGLIDRRGFLTALRGSLPDAVRKLQQGLIAPVDLAQAAIGPGMAVFSSFGDVIEADGRPMTVRTALALINQVLGDVLAEQEDDFDVETRWAIKWFEQHGFGIGPYGTAETLSVALNTSVTGLERAGILRARSGEVHLLDHQELSSDWWQAAEPRILVWKVVLALIQRLHQGGEAAAAELVREMWGPTEVSRDLAYRLYVICERKKWSQTALLFNGLIAAWPDITSAALAKPAATNLEEQLPITDHSGSELKWP